MEFPLCISLSSVKVYDQCFSFYDPRARERQKDAERVSEDEEEEGESIPCLLHSLVLGCTEEI